jgi:hypothetical protein
MIMTHDQPKSPLVESLENRVMLSASMSSMGALPTSQRSAHFDAPTQHVPVAAASGATAQPDGPTHHDDDDDDDRQFAGNFDPDGPPPGVNLYGSSGQTDPQIQPDGRADPDNLDQAPQAVPGHSNGSAPLDDGPGLVSSASPVGPGCISLPNAVSGPVSVVALAGPSTVSDVTPILRSASTASAMTVASISAPALAASSAPAASVAASNKTPAATAPGQPSSNATAQPALARSSLAVTADLGTPQTPLASDPLPSFSNRDNSHLYYLGGGALGSAFQSGLVISMMATLTWESTVRHALEPVTALQLNAQGASLVLAEKVLLADAASAARIAGSVVYRLYEEDTLIWKEMAGLVSAVILIGGYALKKGRDPRRAQPQTHQTVRVRRRTDDDKERTGRPYIIGAPPRSTV